MEDWFNSSMDRVSGVFKRYTQYMALILGLLLSPFLNVDSISVAQYLWREPTVRQVLVAQAISYQPPQTQSGTAPYTNTSAIHSSAFECLICRSAGHSKRTVVHPSMIQSLPVTSQAWPVLWHPDRWQQLLHYNQNPTVGSHKYFLKTLWHPDHCRCHCPGRSLLV